jgi:hypothetical protein
VEGFDIEVSMWRQLAVGAALLIINERVMGQRLGVRTLLWVFTIALIAFLVPPHGQSPFFLVTFGVTTHSIKPIIHFVVRH